jgi:hypothetical protein
MLIGLMGIIFGLGIMYLLSRVMQTSRRVAVVERQAKQQLMRAEEVEAQVQMLHFAVTAPSPVQAAVSKPPPRSVNPVTSGRDQSGGVGKSNDAVSNLPISLTFPPLTWLELTPDMLPGMTELLFGDIINNFDHRVEEVLEDVVEVVVEEVVQSKSSAVVEPEKQESKPAVETCIQTSVEDATNSETKVEEKSDSSEEESVDENMPAPIKPLTRKAGGGGRGGRGAGAGRGRKRVTSD